MSVDGEYSTLSSATQQCYRKTNTVCRLREIKKEANDFSYRSSDQKPDEDQQQRKKKEKKKKGTTVKLDD